MKKLILSIVTLFITTAIFAQGYWKKKTRTDEFHNTTYVMMVHYKGKHADAVWFSKDNKLKFIHDYPAAKAFDVSFDAFMNKSGRIGDKFANVDINKSGEIIEEYPCYISYPEVETASYDFFGAIFLPMSEEEMRKGNFVSVRYYDPVLEDMVVQKVSLAGFSAALNGGKRKK